MLAHVVGRYSKKVETREKSGMGWSGILQAAREAPRPPNFCGSAYGRSLPYYGSSLP